MKKLAVLALCTAGALSCFFVYKKAFADIQVVNYNDYMAAQKQVAAAAEQAKQNLVFQIQNSTPIAQTIQVRFANGTTTKQTVPPYQPQLMQFPQGAQVVMVSATSVDGCPVAVPVDSDLLNKNLKVTLWPMTYASAESLPGGAMILDLAEFSLAQAQAAQEQAAKEQAARNQAAREQAARDQAAQAQAAQQAAQQAARDQAAREQAARDQAARNQAAKDQINRLLRASGQPTLP